MTERLRAILSELRRRLEAHYGRRLVTLVLFGSQARENSESSSDIDVLVVLRGAVEPTREIEQTAEIVSDLSLQFDEVISCVFMSADRYNQKIGPLLRNIEREGVAV